MTSTAHVHAFTDDALGDNDATALAALLAGGAVSPREVLAAAVARAERLQPALRALSATGFAAAAERAGRCRPPGWPAVFAGVPTLVKDNVAAAGLPMTNGSAATGREPIPVDGPVVTVLRALGLNPIGTSAMPEFGLTATTEWSRSAPVANPWNTAYSAGGSSGGSAAAVAAGVVPIAHGNDGGGSLRIPAAACGLVALKPTRRRMPVEPHHARMPIRLICDGVLTRTVRDTARFAAAAEQVYRDRRLPPIGLVTGAAPRRLRVGVLTSSPTGAATESQVLAAVRSVADLLADRGHRVLPVPAPVGPTLVDDFAAYWAYQAMFLEALGRRVAGPAFDKSALEPFTRGLAGEGRRAAWRLPLVIARLRREARVYDAAFAGVDVLLTPTVNHPTPVLGTLSTAEPYGVGFPRLVDYVGFTPLANVAGTPSICLPHGSTDGGLPLSVMFSSRAGDERTLLELAFELEQAAPFPCLAPLPRSAP